MTRDPIAEMGQRIREEGAPKEVRQVVVPAHDCLHFGVPIVPHLYRKFHSASRMDLLSLGNSGALPPLLAHAVEMMQRTHSLAQRIGIRDRGGDVSFGEKNR